MKYNPALEDNSIKEKKNKDNKIVQLSVTLIQFKTKFVKKLEEKGGGKGRKSSR